MSDSMRQSTTDKATSALKPDSQKSMTEKAGDSIKSTADGAASYMQPNSEKSGTQQASDSLGNKTSNAGGETMLESAQKNINAGLQSASEALGLNQKK